MATAIAVAALAGVLTVQAVMIRQPGHLPGREPVLWLVMAWWGLGFIAATALLWAAPRRIAVGLLVGGAIVIQGSAMARGPQLSDDYYRYAWDARVQLAGTDPYRYVSIDPRLDRLHDRWLWPDPAQCEAIGRQAGCTRLNYPRAHTIYPPVAQAWFVLVDVLPGPPREHKQQFYASLASLGLMVMLMRMLSTAGRDPRYAAFYAWSPVAGVDVGSDGHVDVVAALFALGGLALLSRAAALGRRRAAVGGGLLGAAIAVKLYPALLLPAAIRRRPVVVAATAGGVVAWSYLPHALAVGTGVVGFLPEYLKVEGYDQGSRFVLLSLVGLSGSAAKAVAVAVLAGVTATVLGADARRTPPIRAALYLVGAALLIATPAQPWYSLLLVALAAHEARPEWLAVAAAAYPAYVAHFVRLPGGAYEVSQIAYGAAATIVLAVTVPRWREGRTPSAPSPWPAVRPSRPRPVGGPS
ncbi:MAG: glycosyltransferase 87 family protein [Frankia sp.]